ncbi:MAG: fused MFS/spermidine synthase [Bacteroidota bacterium]
MDSKKALSYIFPSIVKKGITSKGQTFEICYENGIKVLNSNNANYSYGSLHSVMQKGIAEILKKQSVNSVLMLGLGAGSAIEILHKKCPVTPVITAIEYDEDIVKIACEDFNIQRFKQLKLIVADAFQWLNNNTTTYDLIIDDIFVDDTIPEQCFNADYLNRIANSLNPGGIYFRNMMNLSTQQTVSYQQLVNAAFSSVDVMKVKVYNNLIYLCKK